MRTVDDSIHVLHVDDEPDFTSMVAAFLERTDDRFEVETVTDAEAGLERLATDDVDCVVSDYDMPRRNGVEFLRAVREQHPELPFILYTGKGSEEVASRAIAAGATDYLQKGAGTEQYELLANRIRNAVEQFRTHRRAAKLDRLRTLASDVNQALVRATSRDEVERRVCEIFSDSEPYRFAWIGRVDPETNRVEPQTAAGVHDGYLDEVTITVDDAPTGHGPAGIALRERRIVVSQNIDDDPRFEPWRDDALERGYRGAAAIPLEYETTLYGLLVAYADRPDAFDEDEQNLLVELGDDIAHALHSFDVRNRLRRERDHRQALFENAPGPVLVAEIHDGGETLVVTDTNDAFTAAFGYETDDVVGKDPLEFMVPETERDEYRRLRKRVNAGEPITSEVERLTADGLQTFLLQVVPYGEHDDHPEGLYAWFTDVSARAEQKRTIETLHDTARMLMDAETATDVADIAVEAVRDVLGMPVNTFYLYDERADRLEPTSWTARAEELIGESPAFPAGEGLAWEVFETGEPQTYDDVSTAPGRLNPETPVRSEIIVPVGDYGTLLMGSTDAGAFDEMDVSLAETLATHAATALDHLERKEELQTERAFIEQTLNTLDDVFFVLDTDGQLRRWNDRVSEITGYSDEELAEMEVVEFFPEGERAKVVDAIEETLTTGGTTVEADVRTAAGDRVLHEFSGSRLTDSEGTLVGLVGIGRDITERKEQEQELRQKNERLEEFAGVLSHDLRNPLNVSEGYLDLVREECDSEFLDNIANANERMERLIDDLLLLAQQGRAVDETDTVDLATMAEGCWQTVDTADATLVVEAEQTLQADPNRLQQLIENLLRNAIEHGGSDVTVTIGDMDDGFYVADDGPGIPPERRGRVFSAGYSTTDRGTGFGLNIVQDIADAHGWDVRITESEHGGARFEITGVEP